jgi:hypothetical protein
MHVTLTREAGSATILTLRAALNQLAVGTDTLLVCAELGCGTAVDVTLADGTAARLQPTEERTQLDLLDPPWPMQALRDQAPSLLQPFNAHCKVMLELDVSVSLMAIDEVHAERIISDVFRGERSPPTDFRVVFDADETHDFMTRLKCVFETGELAKAGVRDVLVTGFADSQRVLEYRP